MFDTDDLQAARRLVAGHVPATPQYRWPGICRVADAPVWLKHENHTATGSFKIRGGLTYFDAMRVRGELPSGVVTATRGNHGQSVPYAASLHDVPVTVLVPEGNSVEKNQAMRGWGAALEVFGSDFDIAREEAERRAREDGLHMVPSFHRDIVLGVATYGYELLTEVQALDVVYVPIGMGSGACAMVGVRDALELETRVVGVVSSAADAVAQSIESGQIVETSSALTFADGMACRVPHPDAFTVMSNGLERVVRVTDDQVAEAMRLIFAETHNVAEGAGAASLAALLAERRAGVTSADDRLAAVVTGGNVDSGVFAEVLSGRTPQVG